jgi:hypothetical protein
LADQRFTDEQLMAALDAGASLRECARRFGVSPTSVRERHAKLVVGGYARPEPVPESVIRPLIQRPRLSEVIELDPQPFAVPIARAATSNRGQGTKCWTALVLTDTHVPYQDEAALQVIRGLVSDVRPRVILHLGDLLDCFTISRFTKDRSHILNLQDEIDAARCILHQFSQLAPDADKYLLEGNHEARLDELLNTLPGTAKELMALRDIRAAATWPSLLRTDEIGWEFVPVKGQAHRAILPRIIAKHGNVVRKHSGMSGKGEWEKYGKSGLSGHVHRLGQFYARDHNGNHTWTECGCTCRLDPPYMEDPDWAHAVVLVHFTPDGSRFSVEPVYIESGRALFGRTEYRAA